MIHTEKERHSFGSNISYEQCYPHNEIITKLITVLTALKIIGFINATIKYENWAANYSSKTMLFHVRYLICCTSLFYLLQKQKYSRYHNNNTQTKINFRFTCLVLRTSKKKKRIIAMEFLDQFNFRTMGILWRRSRMQIDHCLN